MTAPKLVLASSSPRRRALLQQIAVPHSCEPAEIDERAAPGESPAEFVMRMAREKARTVAQRRGDSGCAVLAADTIVVIDGQALGKPVDAGEALQMLERLSGREHTVMTAVCVICEGSEALELVETRVDFVTLSRADCEAYLATDEPWDKAGAYAIQGLAGVFVRGIRGSYSNVVGLPLAETWQMLSAVGVEREPAAGFGAGPGR